MKDRKVHENELCHTKGEHAKAFAVQEALSLIRIDELVKDKKTLTEQVADLQGDVRKLKKQRDDELESRQKLHQHIASVEVTQKHLQGDLSAGGG